MRPSSRNRTKATASGKREHVIDGLGDGIVPGELGAFRARPLFERGDERRASLSGAQRAAPRP